MSRVLDFTAGDNITCGQSYNVHPSETNGAIVDFTNTLRQGEILTGSPTLSVSGMTASSGSVPSTVQIVNGQSVDPGKAVAFTLTGGTDGADYMILVSCGTSNSRTRYAGCLVKARIPTTTSLT